MTTLIGRGIGHTRDAIGTYTTFAGPAALRLVRRAARRGVDLSGRVQRVRVGTESARATATGRGRALSIPVVRVAHLDPVPTVHTVG